MDVAVAVGGVEGAWAASEPDGGGDAATLSWIESLYRSGEKFRAESEILRFTRENTGHSRLSEVELARAKLYYQARRYRESTLMLYSLLDRHRGSPAERPGYRLLGLSLIRQGRIADAEAPLRASGLDDERLAALSTLYRLPDDAVDPERAVTWSTWLPGAGFYVLGQPGKAASALALNFAFTFGAVTACQQGNGGAALVLLLVEIALYSGGREAVREEGLRLNRIAENEQRRAWTQTAGEAALLQSGIPGVAVRIDFGGE